MRDKSRRRWLSSPDTDYSPPGKVGMNPTRRLPNRTTLIMSDAYNTIAIGDSHRHPLYLRLR
jgi:hypothetical protein